MPQWNRDNIANVQVRELPLKSNKALLVAFTIRIS